MSFMVEAKNQMLDGITVDEVSLHYDDPGTTGANEISTDTDYERQSVTMKDASDGERRNDGDITFNISGGEGDNSTVAWVGLWDSGEGTFVGKAKVTEESYGTDGTYTLLDDEGVTLALVDPE